MKAIKYIPFVIVLFLAMGLSSKAYGDKPSFKACELKTVYEELFFCDVDGNGYKDIVEINDANLVFFLQDGKEGFTKKPGMIFSVKEPAVVWSAKMGSGEKILMMSHDGVSVLNYVDKNSPLTKKDIIKRQTVIPKKCKNRLVFFELSVDTKEDSPSLLVPVDGGLEIWRYGKEWEHINSLEGTPDARMWGPKETTGYTKQFWLNMNIGDINGDGLEDIVTCEEKSGNSIFKIYTQNENGDLGDKPAKTYEDEWNWRTWTCLLDINKDSKVDLIKNSWLEEPWFIPGAYSGKVIVEVFISDMGGKISDKPTSLLSGYKSNNINWLQESLPLVL